LVSSTKRQLEDFAMKGFNEFFDKVNSFYEKYELGVVNMNDEYINSKKPAKTKYIKLGLIVLFLYDRPDSTRKGPIKIIM
jgi:hypothetical protein